MNEVTQIRIGSWAAMVKQRNESGMTVKEWCSANGIRESVYYYRLNQLRKMALDACEASANTQTSAQTSGRFVQVPVSPAVSTLDTALLIRRGDTIIEVSSTASDRILSFLKEVMINAG